MSNNPEIPSQIIIDTAKQSRGVILSDELQRALPGTPEAFVKVDEAFLKGPEAYLDQLHESLFTFKANGGPEIPASLLYGSDSKKDEILVIFAAFNDGAPKTGPDELTSYLTKTIDSAPSIGDKQRALPGTWNQTTKSSVIFELLNAIGSGMPVLTIYSPIPIGAYNRGEKRNMREKGDFSPAGRIAQAAVDKAQKILHGAHSESRIDKINFQGASLGASNAIGAADYLLNKNQMDVKTVTAQELIMGPDLGGIIKKFSIAGRAGEPSDLKVSNSPKIYEPHIRQAIDRYGSEPSMYARMFKAARLTYLRGLAHPQNTATTIERLLDNNVAVLAALAENSGLTHQTKSYLPHDKEKVVTVRAEKGQYADHLIDEHVALTGLIVALAVKSGSPR